MDLIIKPKSVDWTPEKSTAQEIKTQYRVDEVYCNQCNHLITDDLYCFESPYYNLCISCYELPLKIHHRLHPQHPLTLHTKHRVTSEKLPLAISLNRSMIRGSRIFYCFVCDGCLYVSFILVYACDECKKFNCCVECASSSASRMPIECWGDDDDDNNNNKCISHYSHLHQLARCRYKPRLDVVKNRLCYVCELPLWGICYGCVHCLHFIHESCVDSPDRISHPIHLSHPLKHMNYTHLDIAVYPSVVYCKGCMCRMSTRNGFFCEECDDFRLHFKCAESLLRTVKHEFHPHDLSYSKYNKLEDNWRVSVVLKEMGTASRCDICNEQFLKHKESCYRCVKCEMMFHFSCVPIPSMVKHAYHLHNLTLADSFDDVEYYCDICETIRTPNSHAYCCQDCNFVAHIECVLTKEDTSPMFLSCLSQAAAYNEPSSGENSVEKMGMQTRHQSHNHELRLINIAADLSTRLVCKMCHLEIRDHSVYACQPCDFWAHKRCIELPEEFFHPLHRCPSLQLLSRDSTYMCQMCRDVSDKFRFICRDGCGFVIDVKCAFETQDTITNRYSAFTTELDHPVHYHLQLVNPTQYAFASVGCRVCDGKILGPRYWRPSLKFYHISCLQLPLQVKHHHLHPNKLFFTRVISAKCRACGYTIRQLGYNCRITDDIYMHIECALAFSRFLKHRIHEHSLYYFLKHPTSISISRFSPDKSLQVCSLCQGEAKTSYYRCDKCELNFHLKCLRLPRILRHKWHLHPLVYKDLVGFGGCYCDICEEEIDLEHPVYCCEDCKLVAHVDCLVSQENASSVVIEEIDDEDTETLGVTETKMEDEDSNYHSSNVETEEERSDGNTLTRIIERLVALRNNDWKNTDSEDSD